MEVNLYVYDLSNGLARSMSAALLGFQLEAVYHTSIVLEDVEYVYDGGIQMVNPGKTHLGPPMRIEPLGKTELPMNVILEYLESMRSIYTYEAYDLWRNNCNNFSNDFATFLLGKGIPDHITNLPAAVLDSPFGRMLQPMIDDMIRNNMNRRSGMLGLADGKTVKKTPSRPTAVKALRTIEDLDSFLATAQKSCAVIFFTSSTCGPCKMIYPTYEELASEASHKGSFGKVDILQAPAISSKYGIRATPTFITFVKGEQENRWSGADPNLLRGNIKLLLEMAWPPHPHESLPLPILRGSSTSPVLYSRLLPLDKLFSKMGNTADDVAVQGVKAFLTAKSREGAAKSTLPDLDSFSWFLRNAVQKLPVEVMFPVIDLLRVSMADPRFSGYYAEEKGHKTIAPIFEYVNRQQNCPYSLRLVALQTACNLFSSPLYIEHILECPTLTAPIVSLVITSLLDDTHPNVRIAAASLSFNIATANGKVRREEKREALPEGDQVELAASLLEAINAEEVSAEALKAVLSAFGHLLYCSPVQGELIDLVKSMDARGTILKKKKLFADEPLVSEIGEQLLGKGL